MQIQIQIAAKIHPNHSTVLCYVGNVQTYNLTKVVTWPPPTVLSKCAALFGFTCGHKDTLIASHRQDLYQGSYPEMLKISVTKLIMWHQTSQLRNTRTGCFGDGWLMLSLSLWPADSDIAAKEIVSYQFRFVFATLSYNWAIDVPQHISQRICFSWRQRHSYTEREKEASSRNSHCQGWA